MQTDNIEITEENELSSDEVREESDFCEEAVPDVENEAAADSKEDLLDGDIDVLTEEFPELYGVEDISSLPGALRYGELRELGLSPREAYLATRPKSAKRTDTRAHLHSAVPGTRRPATPVMTRAEMKLARELFDGMSDREIEELYKRVNKT